MARATGAKGKHGNSVAPSSESDPRFVDFIRVSTKGQTDRDTPEIQRDALDRLRDRRRGIFVDRIDPKHHVSGNTPIDQRPDIQRLIVLAKAPCLR